MSALFEFIYAHFGEWMTNASCYILDKIPKQVYTKDNYDLSFILNNQLLDFYIYIFLREFKKSHTFLWC